MPKCELAATAGHAPAESPLPGLEYLSPPWNRSAGVVGAMQLVGPR